MGNLLFRQILIKDDWDLWELQRLFSDNLVLELKCRHTDWKLSVDAKMDPN